MRNQFFHFSIHLNMKKVFSFAAVALLTVSVLFTACREGGAEQAPADGAAPATETPAAPAQEAAPAEGAGQLTAPADSTGAQQAQ
jgi:hypothetical protein